MTNSDRISAEFTLNYAYKLLAELVVEKLPEDSAEETATRLAMSKIDEAAMLLRKKEAA
jgi:hypothetical protein